jgi:hypothetical protein
MTENTYDPLDRATLATWRTVNVVGWGGAALAAALVIHTVGDQLSRRYMGTFGGGMNTRPARGFGATWQYWGPKYGLRAGVAILAGLAIGLILGTKAWRRPVALAGAVAAVYVLLAWFAIEKSIPPLRFDPVTGGTIGGSTPHHGLPANLLEWSYSALGLFAVVVAPLVARFVARRKNA